LRANNTEVIAVPTDVRDRAQAQSLIDAAVTQFGKLDMLICCAGIYYRRPTYELTLEEVQDLMEVNFYGVLNCVFSALPKLQKQGRGHIAVISSVEGRKGLEMRWSE
jgi:NAD(P)-dependent dehydrogenase (short-subunit alcohol dehydrogenase family)